jgi:hypothetical protein
MSGVPDYDAAVPRRERWLAVRDFVESREQLSPDECRMLFGLGSAEPDRNLGTAVMCGVLYRRECPPDVRARAKASDRAAVRRAARTKTEE